MASILVDSTTGNITGYSVEEDATPLNPADTTGGVGQLDFELAETFGPEGSIQLQGLEIRVSDPFRGFTVGTVNDVKGANGLVTVSADGRLNSLVGNVSAKPMVDTLQAVVYYLLSLGNITDGIYIDPTVAFIPVAVAGFYDDLWLRLKQLVAVHGCELALVGNKIVVRPVRSFQSDTHKQTDFSWEVSKGSAAQFIEVTYYGNTWVDNSVVYPYTDEERASAQSWEVAAGAVLEDDITLSVSLASVQQPTIVDSVPQNYGQYDPETDIIVGGTLASVYSVYDSNNVAVPAQAWRAQGGLFEVSINDDTKSVHIKITAPQDAAASPYRIVGRTGSGSDATDYPSLFLVGTGVYTNPQILRLPTGVSASTSVNEVGDTAQVPAVATLTDAYTTGVQMAGEWSGAELTINGTLTAVNKISGTGSYEYPAFSEFDAENVGKTFAQFDTAHSGQTFTTFSASEYNKVQDSFDNQTFGNVAGARLRYKDAYYRIVSATLTNEEISFSGAKADTTFGDYSAEFAGKSIANFNTLFAGKSFRQFDRIPLNSKASTGTIYVPPVGTDPYPDTFYPDTLNPA